MKAAALNFVQYTTNLLLKCNIYYILLPFFYVANFPWYEKFVGCENQLKSDNFNNKNKNYTAIPQIGFHTYSKTDLLS